MIEKVKFTFSPCRNLNLHCSVQLETNTIISSKNIKIKILRKISTFWKNKLKNQFRCQKQF